VPQLQNKIENQTHKQHNFPGEIKNPAPNKQSGNQRVRDKQRKGITHTKKRDNIPFSEKKKVKSQTRHGEGDDTSETINEKIRTDKVRGLWWFCRAK